MAFTHIDLIGLNKHEMYDAPIVRTNYELKTLKDLPQMRGKSYSIAGMRHSQGGHTALKGECMVFTEAMEQSINVDEKNMTVTINAGATWSDLHFKLGPMGLAPLVHQSSPHFSIGGSLSVDCHGREVTEGALSNTVESITVLTNKDGQLEETPASRIKNPQLFWATLGGYGACGVILNATIRITKNIRMYKFGQYVYKDDANKYTELKKYLTAAIKIKRYKYKEDEPSSNLYMFYAWLNVCADSDKYLNEAMIYSYVPVKNDNLKMRVKWFKDESWASTEAMRAAWAAARNNADLRGELFEKIKAATAELLPEDYLINFLREEISFASSKGEDNDVDLLQEFFIPIEKIDAFLNKLKIILPPNNNIAEVLSCTMRIVQSPPIPSDEDNNKNNKPYLAYANHDHSSAAMISIALEIKVPKKTVDTSAIHKDFSVDENSLNKIREIIDQAHALGGSYYLPYYQAATCAQFKEAYPSQMKWKEAADNWNPKILKNDGKRIFSNEFLRTYLDEK
jgi:FAD binding domain